MWDPAFSDLEPYSGAKIDLNPCFNFKDKEGLLHERSGNVSIT